MNRCDVSLPPAGAARAIAAVLLAATALCGAPSPGRAAPAKAAIAAKPPPSEEARRLDAAMAQVSRNPRNIDTLLEAGSAASAAGDSDAAVGFLRRAEQVAPSDARVLSALAGALLRADDPVSALPVFDRAERARPLTATAVADRGLAYDLVGDNARAQQAYRRSLTLAQDSEVTRRLALSQAIGGDGRGAEVTLRPLLQDQDKAGWRTRAFIFAITGQVDEAVTVARTLLPGDLANAITPYLRFMPRLTRAQQAAAANLGVFPHASDIGRDDPRVAAYVAGAGATRLAGADNPLVPAGAPLGRRGSASAARGDDAPRTRTRAERAEELASRIAPPEPPPATRITSDAGSASSNPSAAGRGDVGVPQLAAIAQQASSRARPTAAARSPALTLPAVPPSGGLAEAFGDLGAPDLPAAPRAGAVDVTRLRSASAPPRAAKPAASRLPERIALSHPSRIWVQLGVGHDNAAMVADWRRLVRSATAAFKGQQPFVSDNGARERMLTGPFATEAAASAFVRQLDTAGIAGPYVWISPAGQVVDPLATK